jgi:ATP-dependent 26S proteasome regulatory subunit
MGEPEADEPGAPDAAQRFAEAAIARLAALRAAEALDEDAVVAADAALDQARAELHHHLAGASPLGGLTALAARAGLPEDEAELLTVAIGVEHRERLQRQLAELTGERDRYRLELGMLALLLGEGARGAAIAGPSSALQRAALVAVEPARTFGRATVRVEPRVLWALAGDRAPDPDLPVDVELLVGSPGEPSGTGRPAVLVHGPDRARRRQRAIELLGGESCLAVRAPTGERAWAALVREATLAGASVLVEVDPAAGLDAAGNRWIERAGHLHWGLSSPVPLDLGALPHLDWRESTAAEHDPTPEEWAHVLGPDVPMVHRLTADQLDRMRVAMAAHDGDFDTAFRRLTNPKLDDLANHLRPRAGWDDLVLSPNRVARLHDLVNRYRHARRVYDEWGFPASPSRGMVALFSGPSGTGKTLAAEVVAGDLGLDLYRLDLSGVVSKWIGETEKNLDELFDAASTGNFLLFFDEADALFGKRGEVDRAQDKYANLETSYLLQRLERYDGAVVMATNYEKNIDPAFMRRIHVRIDFALPTRDERLRIWQRHSEPGPLAGDVDLEWLAEHFELSGAAIRNSIIDAAFFAAADGTDISMAALVRGIALEMRKVGRLVLPEEFGAWFDTAAAVSAE